MMKKEIRLNGVAIEVVKESGRRPFHHRLSSFYHLEEALRYAVDHLRMDKRHGRPVMPPKAPL